MFDVDVRDDGIYVGVPGLPPRERTIADVMAETMTNWGVTSVFGMVGHSNLGLADALRVQEVFGLTQHPQAAGQPITFELLSPAGRPLQVTQDIPGFWASSYADVRRDMRGRYPKHPWPEDPTQAAPTTRTKSRGR